MIDDIEEETRERWRERGGIIRIGLDDQDRLVGFIPIDRLLEITDPVADPPWYDGPDVSREGVMSAIAEGRLHDRPYSSDLLAVCRSEWNSRRHEERIAWLVLNPPVDPIEIEIDQYCGVGIDDGNASPVRIRGQEAALGPDSDRRLHRLRTGGHRRILRDRCDHARCHGQGSKLRTDRQLASFRSVRCVWLKGKHVFQGFWGGEHAQRSSPPGATRP